jgi:hypothetical protein
LTDRLIDYIDEFGELSGGHSMVADILADDFGGQLRIVFVGVHQESQKNFRA